MLVEDDVVVPERHVACNGGGLTGHPKVYLEIGNENRIECPYCGKAFIYQAKTQQINPNKWQDVPSDKKSK